MGRRHAGRLPVLPVSLTGAPPAGGSRGPRSPDAKILSRPEAEARFGPARSFRLVFTNGCFDLLHAGHVGYLNQARRLGDAMVVGINTDASARRLGKGRGRPFVDQDDRAAVLAALESVDGVTLFDEDTPEALIAALQPDVLVKGGDYDRASVAGRASVEARGGQVVVLPLAPGRSSTALAARIRAGEDRS